MDTPENSKNIDLNLFNEKAWEFIRGDLDTPEFEIWLNNYTNLEDIIDKDFYLELISTNYRNKSDIYLLKNKLKNFLNKWIPRNCGCMTLANIDVTDIGSEREKPVFDSLFIIKVYGELRWWLALFNCKQCNQYWLIAEDSRQNDIHCFKRLNVNEAEEAIQNNIWPKYFETLENLFFIGKNFGKSVRFIDPLNSLSLVFSIEDMVKARPSITITEIASLLNLSYEIALELCKKIMQEKNIKINE